MTLNHLNLPVPDPVGMQDFLVKYFDMEPMRKGNDAMALLTDKNGMQLLLMGSRLSGQAETTYPGAFHIGFRQESEDDVNQINQAMKADGLNVSEPSRVHGAWTFYFRSPWGVMIEVVA
ncbi:MAG: VOC family protein [Granulosicoccus sp.]